LITQPDRGLTDRMVQVGNIIHIKVEDHMIFTLDGDYAFSKKGLMEAIRGSKKFVPLAPGSVVKCGLIFHGRIILYTKPFDNRIIGFILIKDIQAAGVYR